MGKNTCKGYALDLDGFIDTYAAERADGFKKFPRVDADGFKVFPKDAICGAKRSRGDSESVDGDVAAGADGADGADGAHGGVAGGVAGANDDEAFFHLNGALPDGYLDQNVALLGHNNDAIGTVGGDEDNAGEALAHGIDSGRPIGNKRRRVGSMGRSAV